MKIFFIIFYKSFKYCTPLTVITKYQLSSPCWTVHPWACLNPSSLCLPLPCPYTAVPPPLSLLVTTGLFSISMGLLLFCYITSWLYFLDSTHKWYHRVFVFLCLTCLFMKDNVMINLCLNLTRPWHLAKHQSGYHDEGIFWKRSTFQSTRLWLKQITLHNVGGHYEIREGLQI